MYDRYVFTAEKICMISVECNILRVSFKFIVVYTQISLCMYVRVRLRVLRIFITRIITMIISHCTGNKQLVYLNNIFSSAFNDCYNNYYRENLFLRLRNVSYIRTQHACKLLFKTFSHTVVGEKRFSVAA